MAGQTKPRAGREVTVGEVTFTIWLPWGMFRKTLRDLEAHKNKADGSSVDILDYMTNVINDVVRSAKGLKDGNGKAVPWSPEALDDYLTPDEVSDLFAAIMNPAGEVVTPLPDGGVEVNPSPA